MALRAGVRRPHRYRQVGTRDAEAVVAARVDLHVGPRRHVATHAARSRGVLRVEVVFRRVVTGGRQRRKPLDRRLPVALQTDPVAFGAQPEAVRIVAVRTAHASGVHSTLNERSPHVDLVLNLAIGVVQPRVESGRQEVVQKRTRVAIDLGNSLTPGVAAGTGLDLGIRSVRRKVDQQARHRRRDSASRRRGARPIQVRAAGTVTGLTADVDRGPGGAVRVALEVVVGSQVRGVALRAHHVPALVAAGPVQRIVGRNLLVGIQVDPLAPRSVPGDGQALEMSPLETAPGTAAAARRRRCRPARSPRGARPDLRY